MKTNTAFAEIIESSLHNWTAQTWEWNVLPNFGSLIYIQQKNIRMYAIVHQIETGSSDPSRTPFPYKKSQEELLSEQPQIFSFLKTTFHCLPLGYQELHAIVYQLPLQPPTIHSFVHSASKNDYRSFFSSERYIDVLFNLSGQVLHIDELFLALFKQLDSVDLLDEKQLERFIELFSFITGNDYRRLKLFLQRIQSLAPHIANELKQSIDHTSF